MSTETLCEVSSPMKQAYRTEGFSWTISRDAARSPEVRPNVKKNLFRRSAQDETQPHTSSPLRPVYGPTLHDHREWKKGEGAWTQEEVECMRKLALAPQFTKMVAWAEKDVNSIPWESLASVEKLAKAYDQEQFTKMVAWAEKNVNSIPWESLASVEKLAKAYDQEQFTKMVAWAEKDVNSIPWQSLASVEKLAKAYEEQQLSNAVECGTRLLEVLDEHITDKTYMTVWREIRAKGADILKAEAKVEVLMKPTSPGTSSSPGSEGVFTSSPSSTSLDSPFSGPSDAPCSPTDEPKEELSAFTTVNEAEEDENDVGKEREAGKQVKQLQSLIKTRKLEVADLQAQASAAEKAVTERLKSLPRFPKDLRAEMDAFIPVKDARNSNSHLSYDDKPSALKKLEELEANLDTTTFVTIKGVVAVGIHLMRAKQEQKAAAKAAKEEQKVAEKWKVSPAEKCKVKQKSKVQITVVGFGGTKQVFMVVDGGTEKQYFTLTRAGSWCLSVPATEGEEYTLFVENTKDGEVTTGPRFKIGSEPKQLVPWEDDRKVPELPKDKTGTEVTVEGESMTVDEEALFADLVMALCQESNSTSAKESTEGNNSVQETKIGSEEVLLEALAKVEALSRKMCIVALASIFTVLAWMEYRH